MTETIATDPPAQTPVRPGPAKVDPETLAIRSRPTRAIRFRRGAIIGAAVVGSVSLTGIAWLALKPQVLRHVAQDSELSRPMGRQATDALAGLPTSYADAPKLGPPLPGDLGRPILRVQERAKGEVAWTQFDTAEAERQKRLADLETARESGLMVEVATAKNATPTPDEPGKTSGRQAAAPSARPSRKERFASALDTASDLNSGGLASPVSPNSLLAGSVIAASLITGLNSDVPGMVIAQVTRNVFDTVTGTILLIPQGARLIGKYDSVVAFGQRRALVVWQRLILPDGNSLRLDNMPATDASGFAGLTGDVDFHTWTLLKGVGIATILGVGSELTISGEGDLVEAIRESAQSNTARAGDRITRRNLDVQPTITIAPGTPVRLLVTRDLILAPWHEQGT